MLKYTSSVSNLEATVEVSVSTEGNVSSHDIEPLIKGILFVLWKNLVSNLNVDVVVYEERPEYLCDIPYECNALLQFSGEGARMLFFIGSIRDNLRKEHWPLDIALTYVAAHEATHYIQYLRGERLVSSLLENTIHEDCHETEAEQEAVNSVNALMGVDIWLTRGDRMIEGKEGDDPLVQRFIELYKPPRRKVLVWGG